MRKHTNKIGKNQRNGMSLPNYHFKHLAVNGGMVNGQFSFIVKVRYDVKFHI